MNVGVIGLGLIGGSMAKALSTYTEYKVFGADRDAAVLEKALSDGAVSGVLDDAQCAACDVVLVALYPGAAIRAVQERVHCIRKGALVVDCCGTKGGVCAALEPLARENGFCFIGGHPMAGREKFGYDASNAELFRGASMILTPSEDVSAEQLQRAQAFFYELGFGRMCICSPAEHDRMIAYTSQLAHVVSSAYVQSPASLSHVGFSAGSFQDMTRVARLNETMWTELFLDNADLLVPSIDDLILRLTQYRHALAEEDADELRELLKEGRIMRENLD